MKKSVFIILLIVSLFLCGCNNNDYSKESSNISKEILNSNNKSSSINNEINGFYLETNENIKLNTSKLTSTKFNELLTHIDGSYLINSLDQHFQFDSLSNYDTETVFRKVETDDYTCYYCIYENSTDNQKAYLFFTPLEDIWVCHEYMILDKNGTPVNTQKKEYTFQTNRVEFLKKIVAGIDLE